MYHQQQCRINRPIDARSSKNERICLKAAAQEQKHLTCTHTHAKAKAALSSGVVRNNSRPTVPRESAGVSESESVFIFYANARVCDSFEGGRMRRSAPVECRRHSIGMRARARHTCGRRFLNLFSALCEQTL
jgi:hypothetical protein